MIRISVPVEVKAMNDIPLTLNHARLTLYRSGVEVQRSEVTASDISAQAGSNHVTRDRALAFTLVFDYTPQEIDAFTMLLSATDANGNTVEATLTNLRYVLDPALQQPSKEAEEGMGPVSDSAWRSRRRSRLEAVLTFCAAS